MLSVSADSEATSISIGRRALPHRSAKPTEGASSGRCWQILRSKPVSPNVGSFPLGIYRQMLGRIIAIGFLATVTPVCVQALDEGGKFLIWGVGTNSCEQWTNARIERPIPPVYMSWIQGFVSSHNHYAEGPNDLGRNIQPALVTNWIDRYCSQHPQDLLAQAAEALVIQLIKRDPIFDSAPGTPTTEGLGPPRGNVSPPKQ